MGCNTDLTGFLGGMKDENYCAEYFESLTEGDLRPILFEDYDAKEDG